MPWWLISDEDVKTIRAALEADEHDDNDFNCPSNPYMEGKCTACLGRELRGRAVHSLDTGMHITEAVPADFREVKR